MENIKIVLTGGPCTGKSSTFDYLKDNYKSLNYVGETARKYIEFFATHEPQKLPNVDRNFFQKFLETKHKENWIESSNKTLFDRSLVDEIAYRQYKNFYRRANTLYENDLNILINDCKTFRYNYVFHFPFWEEIYVCDDVRKETIEDALHLDKAILQAYQECGYTPIIVPKDSINERAWFIIEQLKEWGV